MASRLQAILVLIILVAVDRSAIACPFCYTETGIEVRKLVFGDDFIVNAAGVAAPFPILIASVLLVSWCWPTSTTPNRLSGTAE
jgi:hypothetical protein